MTSIPPIFTASPYERFCRHVKSGDCLAVDMWFGQYKAQRLFPMKCSKIPCPEGSKCDDGEACWKEIKELNKFHLVKLIDGQWK